MKNYYIQPILAFFAGWVNRSQRELIESILLQTYWVMVVMDQFTRRIIGVYACRGAIKAEDLCDMFYKIIPYTAFPKRLSTDNDPLFESLIWKINLGEWDLDEIKSVPSIPWSHPFVERLNKRCSK